MEFQKQPDMSCFTSKCSHTNMNTVFYATDLMTAFRKYLHLQKITHESEKIKTKFVAKLSYSRV